MKPEHDNNGHKYWFYMLMYMNDCLVVYPDPNPVMEDLKLRKKRKGDSFGKPNQYMGANVGKYQFDGRNE